jgi:predicted transcriptional regulator
MKLKAAMRQLDKMNLGPEEYNCSLIMIGVWKISKEAVAVAEWMRFPVDYVSERIRRLHDSGIVTADGIMSDWNDTVTFVADMMVCQGLVTKNGNVYRLTEAGRVAASKE